jgi:prepilin-type processing-associated H-X9-DG protein/prepilin-type N-terminal cleavage/methylation domain-containing protein
LSPAFFIDSTIRVLLSLLTHHKACVQYEIMKRHCFTLIEMLVVIAVVALLVAILISVLLNSKQRAKAVLCGSNIKQLTFDLFMYESDNQNFPYGFYNTYSSPPGGHPGNFLFDKPGWWWFNYTSDYLEKNPSKKTILWCPSRRIRDPKFDYILHGNYGVNRLICKSSDDIQSDGEEFVGKPLRGSDVPHPAQTLLIIDSGYSIIGWWHVTDVPPAALNKNSIEDTAYVPGLEINKDKDLWPGQKEDAVAGRHSNKTVNVGYVDGHCDHTRAVDLFVERTDDTYTNRSPLWSPE